LSDSLWKRSTGQAFPSKDKFNKKSLDKQDEAAFFTTCLV
jgi:hypothetical protein